MQFFASYAPILSSLINIKCPSCFFRFGFILLMSIGRFVMTLSGSGISEFRNLLGYINWFIPFGACADILTAWAGFMAVIYNWENIKGIFDRKV